MKVFGILISLMMLGASSVFAIIDIQGGVWLLSALGGTNTTVAETLTLIENEAQSGNLKEAINKSKKTVLTRITLDKMPISESNKNDMLRWQRNEEQFYTTNSFNNYYWYYKINSKEDISEEDIFQAKYGY